MTNMLLANHERFAIGSRSRRANPRTLFAQNEFGTILDPSITEAARSWRRNLWTYSDQFGSTAWTKTRCSVNENTTSSPVGTGTADELIENTDNNTHILSRTYVCEPVVYTLSVYAKSMDVQGGLRQWFSLQNGSLVGVVAHFDLVDGVVGTVGASCTADMEYAGDGWYRCWITFQAASGSNEMRIRLGDDDNSPTYQGDGASGIYIDGYQLEAGSAPTDYQRITDGTADFISAFLNNHFVYQDFQGQAAATAPGDLVGIVLDQSKDGINNLGAELVTDGDFSDGSGWTLTDATISGGKVQVATAVNGVIPAQRSEASVSALPLGTVVRVEYTISNYVSGQIRARVGSSGNFSALRGGNGTYRETVVINSGPSFTTGFTTGSTGFTGDIDNFSIKVIPGCHAYQATSGARPTLARVPFGGRRNLLTYSDLTTGAVSGTPGTGPTGWVATGTDGTLTVTSEGLRIAVTAGRRGFHQVMTLNANTVYCFSAICDIHTADSNHQIIDFVGLPAGATKIAYQDGVPLTAFQDVVVGTNSKIEVVVTVGATAGTTSARFGAGVNNLNDVSDVTFKQIQFEVGSTRSTYQRVGSTHDVTEAGKADCWYLDSSGSKWMQTKAIDFPGWTQETTRNLVRGSEFWGTPWTQWITSATYGEAGPEGRNNAATFVNVVGSGGANLAQVVSYVPNQSYVLTFWVKAGTSPNGNFGMFSTASGTFINATGTILSGPGSIFGTALMQLSGLTSSWTKVQLVFTSPATNNLNLFYYVETSGARTGLSNTLAQFQIEPGSTPTAYQPTGTDEMTVISGVRKLSDAASAAIVELGPSASSASYPGSFHLLGPGDSGASSYRFTSRGGSAAGVTASSIFAAAPDTSVLTGEGCISEDIARLRRNGVEIDTDSTDQGWGNYGNYALYLFSRTGTSLFFSAHFFYLIIRGRTTPEATIKTMEKLVAKKTGITI
jgi:hypothetical protein